MKLFGHTLLAAGLALAVGCGSPAHADDGVSISDAGSLKWVVSGSRVYLRNLSDYDSSWQGCCYNYYIDITTDEGKAMFSALLTSYAAHLPIIIYVANKATTGAVTLLGRV